MKSSRIIHTVQGVAKMAKDLLCRETFENGALAGLGMHERSWEKY